MADTKQPFSCTTPCKNCPYRKDAPLALWSVQEFIDLLENDADLIGKIYGCHKNDGSLCRGFLMNQDKRGLPSIALRMKLSKERPGLDYFDKLTCKAEMYESIEEMAKANYPEIFKHLKV